MTIGPTVHRYPLIADPLPDVVIQNTHPHTASWLALYLAAHFRHAYDTFWQAKLDDSQSDQAQKHRSFQSSYNVALKAAQEGRRIPGAQSESARLYHIAAEVALAQSALYQQKHEKRHWLQLARQALDEAIKLQERAERDPETQLLEYDLAYQSAVVEDHTEEIAAIMRQVEALRDRAIQHRIPTIAGRSLLLLGRLFMSQGDTAQARDQYQAAHSLFRSMGHHDTAHHWREEARRAATTV